MSLIQLMLIQVSIWITSLDWDANPPLDFLQHYVYQYHFSCTLVERNDMEKFLVEVDKTHKRARP